MQREELIWLAGLLEGEGSFMIAPPSSTRSGSIISVQMIDEDIVDKVASLFGVSRLRVLSKNPRHKNSFVARLTGKRAIKLMEDLQPLMGKRRSEQIDRCLINYKIQDGVKITAKQAGEIYIRYNHGEKAIDLANEYNVSKWLVYRISEGKRSIDLGN